MHTNARDEQVRFQRVPAGSWKNSSVVDNALGREAGLDVKTMACMDLGDCPRFVATCGNIGGFAGKPVQDLRPTSSPTDTEAIGIPPHLLLPRGGWFCPPASHLDGSVDGSALFENDPTGVDIAVHVTGRLELKPRSDLQAPLESPRDHRVLGGDVADDRSVPTDDNGFSGLHSSLDPAFNANGPLGLAVPDYGHPGSDDRNRVVWRRGGRSRALFAHPGVSLTGSLGGSQWKRGFRQPSRSHEDRQRIDGFVVSKDFEVKVRSRRPAG